MANANHSGERTGVAEARSDGDRTRPAPADRSGRQAPPRRGGEDQAQEKRHFPEEWARVYNLARKQLDRCVSLQPKVLQGEKPGAVHDLRVASRRLQQALDLIFPSPRPREIRKVRRRLKRCRKCLSEIRNCDVLLARVEGALARKRTARREAQTAIREYLLARRAASYEKALRKLAGANLSDLYVRIKEYLPPNGAPSQSGEDTDAPAGAPAPGREELYAQIGQNLMTRCEALEEQVARSRREPDAAIMHRVRIAAKRLRYLVEVIHALGVAGGPEVLIWLRNLQKHLGAWHDMVVFEEVAIEMIANPDFLRKNMELGLEIEKLILRNRVLRIKLEEKYLEDTADQKDFLRIKEWIDRIVATPSDASAPAGKRAP